MTLFYGEGVVKCHSLLMSRSWEPTWSSHQLLGNTVVAMSVLLSMETHRLLIQPSFLCCVRVGVSGGYVWWVCMVGMSGGYVWWVCMVGMSGIVTAK